MRVRNRSRRKGFALVSALWLVVALSLVALEFSLSSRDRRRAALNRVESMRLGSVADAGLEHARIVFEREVADASQLLLAGRANREPWSEVEEEDPTEGELEDGRYRVTALDLGARLNVNRADEAMLRRFLGAAGVDAGRADRLAQTIMDWKDADGFRRARGAERVEYLEAGALDLPADGAFRSVAELRHVRGMTKRDFERIEPLVTVRGSGRVNLSSAPPSVLRALPGMHDQVLALVLQYRESRRPMPPLSELASQVSPDVRDALERALPELVSLTTPDTRELLLTSEAWLEGSPIRRIAEAVLLRAGGSTFLMDRRVP